MEEIVVESEDGTLLGAVRAGADPVELVLLHAGVADRRSWQPVMERLAPQHGSVAFDRPGFGTTAPATLPTSAVAQLWDVVTATTDGQPVVLVGSSQGGRIAIDAALEEPTRVQALVLVASVTSGDPPIDWDAELGSDLVAAIEAAEEAGDLDAVNAYDARVWLDGPRSEEGRVSGPVRELFLAMNAIALRNGDQAPELEPPPASERLAELDMPVLVVTGALDLGAIDDRCRALARAVPNGRHVELPDTAHLPALESPAAFADVLASFLDGLPRSR